MGTPRKTSFTKQFVKNYAKAGEDRRKKEERDKRNKARNLARQGKEKAILERELMIETNLDEVEEHNNYIEEIQNIYKYYSEQINWKEVEKSSAPEPVKKAEELKDYFRNYVNELIDKEIDEAKKL